MIASYYVGMLATNYLSWALGLCCNMMALAEDLHTNVANVNKELGLKPSELDLNQTFCRFVEFHTKVIMLS